MIYSYANLALLTAASSLEYWNQSKPAEKKTTHTLDPSVGNNQLADQLEAASFMVKAAKKVLKWTKKGMRQVAFALRSGMFTSEFSTWVRSPKAIQLYIMAGGTLALTYQNWKSPKRALSLMGHAKNVAWAVTSESKKIVDSYNLIIAATAIVKKPKNHLLPMTFAATMVLASHLANR